MPASETEIHSAYEVQCENCFEFIVLRNALDDIHARRCPCCKYLLPPMYLLLQMIRQGATKMFSFGCDACGRENSGFQSPTRCRYCGEAIAHDFPLADDDTVVIS